MAQFGGHASDNIMTTESQLSPNHSRFTYSQLHQLRTFGVQTPLRVVAHIDLDAFYAQCETVRLGISRDIPLAVQQWESLIAVNYAARPFGITRMINAQEAQKRCPKLVLQHVATFREGQGVHWAYRDDAASHSSTDKVCLDPYRNESRAIMMVMRDALATWSEEIDQRGPGERKAGANGWKEYGHMLKFEKGSIDEAYIDLSALVYATILYRHPHLQEREFKEASKRKLPLPPIAFDYWSIDDCIIDLPENETDEDDDQVDWDDVVISIGAEIVKYVRKTVFERLRYTCSGGIARNKMLAKLASSSNKPNKQTVVRNRAVMTFLQELNFTKIRFLGGKLGKQISNIFGTEQLVDLLPYSLQEFRQRVGEGIAVWLYDVIRGDEFSQVNDRIEIKSMLSQKSFSPPIRERERAESWLDIFAADIYNRLVEDGILQHKRRPKTITMHYLCDSSTSKSRSTSLPPGKEINQTMLCNMGKVLLNQAISDEAIWPCHNFSLSVSGFEVSETGNQSLHGFFSIKPSENEGHTLQQENVLKRKSLQPDQNGHKLIKPNHLGDKSRSLLIDMITSTSSNPTPDSVLTLQYQCGRCKKDIPESDRDEHDDWHFAKDLVATDRTFFTANRVSEENNKRRQKNARSRSIREAGSNSNKSNPEKGQKRLNFG